MTDPAPIRALWDQMAAGWAAGSGERFAGVFSPDTEFVSVRGERQHGRLAVAASHQALFETRYRATTLAVDVQPVRFLSAAAAVVHVASSVCAQGRPSTDTHAQAVVEQRDGQWLITAFHNMIPFVPAG